MDSNETKVCFEYDKEDNPETRDNNPNSEVLWYVVMVAINCAMRSALASWPASHTECLICSENWDYYYCYGFCGVFSNFRRLYH